MRSYSVCAQTDLIVDGAGWVGKAQLADCNDCSSDSRLARDGESLHVLSKAICASEDGGSVQIIIRSMRGVAVRASPTACVP